MKKWKGKRIAALLLGMALITNTVDISALAVSASENRKEGNRTSVITAFQGLPEEVREQTLQAGAAESDIIFPDTLTVTVEQTVLDPVENVFQEEAHDTNPIQDDQQEENTPESEVTAPDGEEEHPDSESAYTETPDSTTETSEEESAQTDETQGVTENESETASTSFLPLSALADLLPQPMTVYAAETEASVTKEIIIEGITWELDADNSDFDTFYADDEHEGAAYTYVPKLPEMDSEGNMLFLADEVELPVIYIRVGQPQIMTMSETEYSGLSIETDNGTIEQDANGQIILRGGGAYTISGTWTGGLNNASDGAAKYAVVLTADERAYNITLNGSAIRATDHYQGAFSIESGAFAAIRLVGENTLISAFGCAGLRVPKGAMGVIGGPGSLTASGFEAGIGGGRNEVNGDITISTSSTIRATGYNGAGIGGGYVYSSEEQGGRIIIFDGTIIAKGGDRSAGIGGGYCGSSGKIFINGDVVEAEGGNGGAGIGSGDGNGIYNVVTGEIAISSDAIVTAVGGKGGAGIGGGRGASSGNVEISGSARVKATGLTDSSLEFYGAGIGGGAKSSGGGCISGGNLTILGRPWITAFSGAADSATDCVSTTKNFEGGVVFAGSDTVGTVYGSATILEGENVSINSGIELTLAEDASRTVSEGATLTVNGTLNHENGTITVNGTLDGNGIINPRLPVEIDGMDKKITYVQSYDISQLFSVPSNAGPISYKLEGDGSGKGTLSGTGLSIDSTGTFFITAITEETNFYAAAEKTVKLTVENGTIPDAAVKLIPYTGTYDTEHHDAVTVSSYPEGSNLKIEYSESLDGDFTEICPKVRDVADSGKCYYVRISLDNYDAWTGVSSPVNIVPKDLADLSDFKYQNCFETYYYTGDPIRPDDILMEYKNDILSAGNGFTIDYGENTEVGADPGTMIFTGDGNYTGTTTKMFDIVFYDGEVDVKFNGGELSTVEYTKDVTITAEGYTIASELNGEFKDSFIADLEGENTYTLYFKQDLNGYVTNGIPYTIKIKKPVISVDIYWGAMTYTYEHGIWDSKAHAYEGGGWKPDNTEIDKGTEPGAITVTNNSAIDVGVDYHFAADDSQMEVEGSFTKESVSGEAVTTKQTLGTDDTDHTQTVYLNLQSGRPSGSFKDRILGNVTVVIQAVEGGDTDGQ